MLNERVAYEKMGAPFLAAQPIEPKAEFGYRPNENWADLFTHAESSFNAMKTWRWSWWSHWVRLAEFFKPRRMHLWVTPNRFGRGHAINDSIIDGSPAIAVNICASGMWAGMTNPARVWFKIEPRDEKIKLDSDGQLWVNEVATAVLGVMEKSNFYTIMAQAFEDLAIFGTAPMIIYEDEKDVIRLYLPCAGEYLLKVGARFSNDTLAREFLLNVLQIVEMFSFEMCPPEIQDAFRQGGARLTEEFVICHMIDPNYAVLSRAQGGKKISILPGAFAFREIYWLRGKMTPQPLSLRGFNEAPFFTLLWSRQGNDAYGRSAGMDALGDNKQLQRSTMRKGEFIEKLVRPSMVADVSMKNEPSSIMPGMTTYVNTQDGKKGFFPAFEVNPAALAPLVQDIEKVSQRIDKALFVDVFMAITNMEGVEPRNELELTKRDLERLQRLGPVINLVENALSDAILRIMLILERQKTLRPMPKSVEALGGKMKLTFESINRLAQRAAESAAMKDTFVTLGELSSAAKAASVPDPIRTFNLDKAAKRYATSNNFPVDCIFTDQEVQEHDQARHQVLAGQHAAQTAMAGVQAAKTLSETQVPGGTALGALMGGGQGGGA